MDKEVLVHINNEYQTFIKDKLSIIDLCKTFHKEILSKLENMIFPKLDRLLKPHFSNIITLNNNTLVCDICNKFEAPTNRSLSRHKASCLKKQNKIDRNQEGEEVVIT